MQSTSGQNATVCTEVYLLKCGPILRIFSSHNLLHVHHLQRLCSRSPGRISPQRSQSLVLACADVTTGISQPRLDVPLKPNFKRIYYEIQTTYGMDSKRNLTAPKRTGALDHYGTRR